MLDGRCARREGGAHFIERSGLSPIFPVTTGDVDLSEVYEGRYECLQGRKRSSTCEEYARASAIARKRSGCLVFTPFRIASGVPRFGQHNFRAIALFAGESDVRAADRRTSRGPVPTFLCGCRVKVTTVWRLSA